MEGLGPWQVIHQVLGCDAATADWLPDFGNLVDQASHCLPGEGTSGFLASLNLTFRCYITAKHHVMRTYLEEPDRDSAKTIVMDLHDATAR